MTLSTQRAGVLVNAKGPLRTTVSPTFPIRASGSGRYPIDSAGVAFPMLGRVCWVMASMSAADRITVLDDTVAKNFNTIELKIPNAPEGFQFNADDELPFTLNLAGGAWDGQVIPYSDPDTEAPDFTTPNEAFWADIDDFLNDCLTRSLLVMVFPSYVGFPDTDWWMTMMLANGPTKMQTYGAWFATRYAAQTNLVFMVGGDAGTGAAPFSVEEAAVVEAFNAGLKSVATASPLYSAEWLRESIVTDLYPALFAPPSGLNGTYASEFTINALGADAWAYTPRIPAYAQEYPFETPGAPSSANRRNTIWAWMSTGGGYLYGVHAMFEPPTPLANLSTPGTLDCARLNALISSLEWQTLQPNNGIVTAGGGTPDEADQVTAMADPQGALAVVYLPPAHTGTVTVTMTTMRAATTSRWWDPTSGFYTADATGIAASGTHVFTRPGNNSGGAADWILVLTLT